MPFDGNGTYTLPSPEYPAVSGTAISSSDYNDILADLATALSNCITRDGQSPATNHIPLGNFRITGLGNPVASTDAVSRGWLSTSAPFTQTGTGAIDRTITSKLQDQRDGQDFGLGDGTDEGAKLQALIDSAPAYSKITLERGKTWGIGTKVVVNKALHIVNHSTIIAVGAGVLGTPLIEITYDDVIFENFGYINGANSAWSGIYVGSATVPLNRVEVTPGKMANFNPTSASTSQFAVSINSVIGGKVGRGRISNCGGFGLYTQYCQGLVVDDVQTDLIKYTGINSSAGLDCFFNNCQARRTGFFGMKAGYGLGGSNVTADTALTTTSFSITKNASTTLRWRVGLNFLVIRTVNTCYWGKVKTIVDNGTYYTITTAKAMAGAPVAGDVLEIVDNSIWNDPVVEFAGDNGFDFNIVGGGGAINRALVRFAGEYTGLGSNLALGSAIWVGADPQGGNQGFQVHDFTINDCRTEHSAGDGITVFAVGTNVYVNNPVCLDYDEVQEAPGTVNPTYGGVSINRLAFSRCEHVGVRNPVCNSPNGFGVLMNFALYGFVDGGDIKSGDGVIFRDAVDVVIFSNPRVLSTVAGAAAFTIDGAATPTGVAVIGSGRLQADGVGSTAFRVSSANAANVTLGKGVLLYNASANVAITSATANLTFQQEEARYVPNSPRSTRFLGGAAGTSTGKVETYSAAVTAGATVALASVTGSNGACGGVIFRGFAYDAAAGAEAFEVMAGGNSVGNTLTFTSLGAQFGATFLAAGDFTIDGSVPAVITLKYTNNEADTVNLTGVMTLLSQVS